MPKTRIAVLFMVFAVGPAMFAQSKADSLQSNYLIFKVSDQSVDEDGERIENFLAENYGLTDNLESYSYISPTVAYRILDGWEFNKYGAVEAELIYYDETNLFVRVKEGEDFHLKKQSYAASVSIAGRYPVLKNLDLYGKAGVTFWRTDSKLQRGDDALPAKVHEDKIQGIFGAGARWSVTRNLVLDLSVEKTEVDGFDVDTVSIGIGFRY